MHCFHQALGQWLILTHCFTLTWLQMSFPHSWQPVFPHYKRCADCLLKSQKLKDLCLWKVHPEAFHGYRCELRSSPDFMNSVFFFSCSLVGVSFSHSDSLYLQRLTQGRACGWTETRQVLMVFIAITTSADKMGNHGELEGENWNWLTERNASRDGEEIKLGLWEQVKGWDLFN